MTASTQDQHPQDTALSVALHVISEWPGARVLPVDGKTPAYAEVPHGSRDATDDPETVAAWFAGTSYGVAVTGVLAIDCDHPDLLDAPDSIHNGVVISGNPDRFTVLFAQPDDPFGDGRHAAGEVKGSGYVVLPPSRHDGGEECPTCPEEHPYVWLSGVLDGLPTLPVDLEAWLAPKVRRQAERGDPAMEVPPLWLTTGDPCRSVLRPLDTATLELSDTDASKHPVMTEAVLALLRLGEQGHAGVAQAMSSLYTVFLTACRADSAERARVAPGEFQRAVLGAVPVIERAPTPGEEYGCCSPEHDPALDDLVFAATPLLEHVKATADDRGVGRWALLGSSMARAVAEVPPHVRLPAYVGGDASLNLYVALVDPSGGGKSTAHKAAAETFTGMAYARQVPNGTGEGLIASFMQRTPKGDLEADPHLPKYRVHENPQVLMYVDEIGQLQVGAARSGASIEPILRSMWNGEHVGTNNADPDRNRNLLPHSYRLCLVAGVQPGLAGSLLSGQATTSGTAQRWLWLPVTNPFAPDDPDPVAGPWMWDAPPSTGGVLYISFPPYVREQVRAARLRVLRGFNVTEEDAIRSHRMLCQMKVAAAVAVLHGTRDVDDLYWGIAGAIMEKSDATRAGVLHLLAAKAEAEQEARGYGDAARERGRRKATTAEDERIATKIAKVVTLHDEKGTTRHGRTGCTKSCLTLAVRNDERGPVLEEAIRYALDLDWIARDADHFRPGGSTPR